MLNNEFISTCATEVGEGMRNKGIKAMKELKGCTCFMGGPIAISYKKAA